MLKTNTLINACKGENKSRANGLSERLCGRATCHILLGGGTDRVRERGGQEADPLRYRHALMHIINF